MKTALVTVLVAGAMILFFALMIWWQVYRYHDCKMVGHSTIYCIGSIGR
jgi:hypothetical protein